MNIQEFKSELNEIKNDDKSGSIGILNKVIGATTKFLSNGLVNENLLSDMYEQLSQIGSELPDFVVLSHFIEYLYSKRGLNQDHLMHSVEHYIQHWAQVDEKIAKKMSTHVDLSDSTILLHSQSSTVQHVLFNLKQIGVDAKFYQTHSNPGGEGKIQADLLRGKGFNIELIEDNRVDELIGKLNYCFFGADVVLNKVFINKVGTADITKLAIQNQVPVMVLADSRKIIDKSNHYINLEQLERVSLENVMVVTEL